MSDPAAHGKSSCTTCLRRSWLLAALSAALDYRCADLPRLLELLALDDGRLLHALAGRRRATLKSDYLRFGPAQLQWAAGVGAVCRHDRSYPAPLRAPGAPQMLNVLGGPDRLRELTRRPVVAVVGSRMASDYGVEIARSLGRGLSASGVTVVGAVADGIALAAHSGALEVGGASVAVCGHGLGPSLPTRRRGLVERLSGAGCVVSELPCGCEGRRWGPAAAARTGVLLAEVTVVVEAGDSARELSTAGMARSLGRTLAAVPGRVTSRGSRGTNALLLDGARLVRDAGDVLQLLRGGSLLARPREAEKRLQLEPRLAEVLERVGEGRDTPDRLIAGAGDLGEVLLALSELELRGLLTRGDGGRYVRREPGARLR